MELGALKDRLDETLEELKLFPKESNEAERLTKRADELRRMIQDEEARQAKERLEFDKLELEKLKLMKEFELKEIELDQKREENAVAYESSRKDRIVKTVLGAGTILLGIGAVLADDTRVICKPALDVVASIKKGITF